ncbi:MAG: gfo/Idh/MocA family oxidoreductase, partial [Roseivirga sp.]|nr:gfo/Idh/MocA family oxidoreductase [Roseivirga sp.]
MDRKELRLGVIGLSDGNGHPYSWSAIFNGYNPEYMKDCPFPVIPQYLSERSFPADAIKGAVVTHIWTQDEAVSRHIAKASKIQTVCQKMEDMIGQVDAVLLARDDAE